MLPTNFDAIKIEGIELAKKKPRPQFTVIYGSGGIGKTSLACYSPDPVIIPIGRETGHERHVDQGIPCFENTSEMNPVHFVLGCIQKLLKTEHSRKTVIFDNLGAYTEAVFEDVENDNKGVDLSAFGKKQGLAYPYHTRLLAGVDALLKKGINVVLIAHSVPVNINLPDGSYYQTIAIHGMKGDNTNVVALIEARCHNCLYIKAETHTRKVKGALGVEKVIGSQASIKRVVYTRQSGSYFAKARGELEEMYYIEDAKDHVELLKDRSNESMKAIWHDIYNK